MQKLLASILLLCCAGYTLAQSEVSSEKEGSPVLADHISDSQSNLYRSSGFMVSEYKAPAQHRQVNLSSFKHPIIVPNPVQGDALEFVGMRGKGSIAVYDASGELVDDTMLAAGESRYSTKHLQVGAYLLILKDSGGMEISAQKLIKK